MGLLLLGCNREEEPSPNVLPDENHDDSEESVLMNLPEIPAGYAEDDFPTHFYQTEGLSFFQSINEVEIDNDKATLGRVLFYDKNLSKDNLLSCASCHNQSNSFSGALFPVTAAGGNVVNRSAPALVNKEFDIRVFWDLRKFSIEQQISSPITDPHEMNISMTEVIEKLNGLNYYPELAFKAFNDSTLDSAMVVNAIAQFVRSIRAYDTKYHNGLLNDFSDFTESELRGKDLFFNQRTHCNQCHMTSNFYTPGSENNGLDELYEDGGVEFLTGSYTNNGYFKVPSLLNVAFTGPYMHDGRFSTLEEVIDFYNEGIQEHEFLSDQLTSNSETGGEPLRMNLTPQEKADLVTFLKTLSDYTVLEDEKFSDPFID